MNKIEKQKCELMKKLIHESLFINSDEEGEKMFWQGHAMMEDLVKSKDTGILIELIDLFTDENENGVCENLINSIWKYYSIDQILYALNIKFNWLVNNNMMRSVQFFGYCLNAGYFNDMRKLFNNVRSEKSAKFLEEFIEWYKEDYPQEIAILRNDMKNW